MRIIYKDVESTYSELLEKDCAVTIHTKNIQLLMNEMYKTRNDLNPSFLLSCRKFSAKMKFITICVKIMNSFNLG